MLKVTKIPRAEYDQVKKRVPARGASKVRFPARDKALEKAKRLPHAVSA